MTQLNNEAFEKFMHSEGYAGLYIGDGQYKFSAMQLTWEVWQAAKADSESILKQQQNTIADLKEKLNTELKRVNSYKNLVASLEGQVSHYSKKDYSLASEQEMNEVLTNENTELQAHINVLREALEKIVGHDMACSVIAKQALASTPAQSLAAERKEQWEARLMAECTDLNQ